MNNVYVEIFKEKVRKDLEKEKQELDTIKQKQMEVQQYNFKQLETRTKGRGGMSLDEAQLNANLLKEIAERKDELKSSIMKT